MIIALGHKSRVGKDTIATMLEEISESYSRIPVRTGFAWNLKSTATTIYAWAGLHDREHYERYPAERSEVLPLLGLTPVQVWTQLGDALTAINPASLVEPVLRPDDVDHDVIISDLRRPSEMDIIHKHMGFTVRVVRPGAPSNVSTADAHLIGNDDWDYVIVNDGSQLDLRFKAERLYQLCLDRFLGNLTDPSAPARTASYCPFCDSRHVFQLTKFKVSVCGECHSGFAAHTNREVRAQ